MRADPQGAGCHLIQVFAVPLHATCEASTGPAPSTALLTRVPAPRAVCGTWDSRQMLWAP